MAYDFRLKAGFQNLRVLLDTVLVPPAGTVTMDRDRLLLATADTTVIRTSVEVALSQAMRSILEGPPMAAYRALSDEVERLYDRDGPFEASRRLRIAQAFAFDPVRDAPNLRRALAEIGDSLRVEALSQPRNSAVVMRGLSESTSLAAAPGGPGQTTILYVNGIANEPFEAAMTWKKVLAPIVQTANLPKSSTYPVWGYYNPTSKYQDSGLMDFWTCLDLQANQYGLAWFSQVYSSIQSCSKLISIGGGSDLAESAVQVANILWGPLGNEAQQSAGELGVMIRQILGAGGRVVVVAHSQGNLMATEALSLLNRDTPPVDSRCVGVVSIAPPVPVTLALGAPLVSTMIIEDGKAKDVLLVIPNFISTNATTNKVTNALSDAYNRFGFVDLPVGSASSAAASLWAWVQSFLVGKQLHSINGSYLGYPETVASVQAALRTQVDSLDVRCPAPLPNPVLAFTGTEVYVDGFDNELVRFKLAVTNYQAYPAEMFAPAPNLPPCGLNTNASRTWVNIYDASNDSRLNTFCGLERPSDLQLIWFAEPVGTPPPLQVYITLVDRATGLTYMSNSVVPTATLALYTIGTSSSPSNGGSTSGGGTYTAGSAVTVIASAASGFAFVKWTENGSQVSSSATYTFTASANRSLVANFSANPVLTVTGSGAGTGSVTANVGGINCSITAGSASGNCSASFNSGTSVTLTATPASGHTFAGWSGACSGTGSCQVTMTQARSVTASFTAGGSIVFAQVAAGGGHTCGLTSTGVAYCWGDNGNFGQLGDGTTQTKLVPTPVSGGLSFVGITAGSSHTCGLTSTGAAYCWGNNNYSGAIGDGTKQDRYVPTPVTGGLNFVELTAGYLYTCGRTSAGTAYCWGTNNYGELGDGTTLERLVPTPVGGGLTFIQLTAGIYHTCGLTSTGAAYCWGNNLSGELGVGEVLGLFDKRLLPTPVVGGISFVQLTASIYNTCGISSAGAAFCWGDNLRGQLGEGRTMPRSLVPTPVAGGLSFVAVTAGGSGTCGLTSGGLAYCWGYNVFGQLGDGTTQDRSVPTPVAGALNFGQLTKGSADRLGHTCGRTTAGTVHCWGYNGAGQLGDGTQQSRLVPTPVKSP